MLVGELTLVPPDGPVSEDVELPSIGIVLCIEDPLPIAMTNSARTHLFYRTPIYSNSSVISYDKAVGSASRYEMSIR